MRLIGQRALTLAGCLIVGLTVACSHPEAQPARAWDKKAAAGYLDQREGWWMQWTGAARDHQTFCVSCHTAVPYALARPTLRSALGEATLSANEQFLLDNVRKRVRLWKDIGPYYSGQGYDTNKNAESRGTESVLNALILASYDAQNGRLDNDTRAAFDHMWAMQQTTGEDRGSWSWLQFDLEPWESNAAQYYGVTLAAVAVGMAPENYRSRPEIQTNLNLLREYLDREYAAQSTINRVGLLWASVKLPGLIETQRRASIIDEALSKQESDGGWRLSSVAWRGGSLFSLVRRWLRDDGTPLESKSDGYATGMITLALQQAGLTRENAQLQRGLSWLVRSQNQPEGFWLSSSLNKRRSPSSDTGRFMSDAATAYAVLALTETASAGPGRVAAK